MDVTRFERVEISGADALWDWLARNHTQADSILLVTWKKHHGARYVSREAVLDALVAYGWIDGRRFKLDDDRTMQLISPRQQKAWAKSYKVRAERLIRDGLMKQPGLDSIAAAKVSGQWNASDAVDQLIEPPALIAALEAGGGLAWWRTAAPSYRRNVLRWVASGKAERTRQKRIDIIASYAARGEKIRHY